MSDKIRQHIVPKTYLKYWRISENENRVFGIDFSNIYEKKVVKFGINSKIFIRELFYNSSAFDDPFAIENMLGEDIEPNYHIIMKEIEQEINLSVSVREKIIQWLYISKMRSEYIRRKIDTIAKASYILMEKYKGNVPDEEAIAKHVKKLAKDAHLSTLSNSNQMVDLVNLYTSVLIKKQWCILKSIPGFGFWTNDNPGFSINTNPKFAMQTPFHKTLEMNDASINLFPLSPHYCLQIMPFEANVDPNINAMSMEIKYVQIGPEYINEINNGVFRTRNKIIISDREEALKQCIKWEKSV